MAIVNVNRGGVEWICITPSEKPTWRMFWDADLVVQELIETDEESLTLATNNGFESQTKQGCVDKAQELGLLLPDVMI